MKNLSDPKNVKYKLSEACEPMNLEIRALRHYVKIGLIPTIKINGRYYIEQGTIEQWKRGEFKTKGAFQKESDIERYVIDHLPKGVIGVKLHRTNWPDRVFFFKNGRVMFIEFKRPGEEPRIEQTKVHLMLTRFGFSVFVCDDKHRALEIIKKFLTL